MPLCIETDLRVHEMKGEVSYLNSVLSNILCAVFIITWFAGGLIFCYDHYVVCAVFIAVGIAAFIGTIYAADMKGVFAAGEEYVDFKLAFSGSIRIYYRDITQISCVPYNSGYNRIMCEPVYRLRLDIVTEDGGEFSLNDRLDYTTDDILTDMNRFQSKIKNETLMELYDYINKRRGSAE